MSRKQKKVLIRIIVSGVLLVAAKLIDSLVLKERYFLPELLLYLLPYFIIGYDVLWNAARNIIRGQVFDENFLMAIATVGAICIGFFPNTEKNYAEAVFVMLFYQTGELFQSIAVGKSRRSISALMDIRPDVAYIERNGAIEEVEPEQVAVGDIIVVRPGDRVPLDGTVLSGESALDTVALTGESVPREVSAGNAVISGCINISAVLKVKVTKAFGESTVSRILELVENSSAAKSRSENFITRFARYYTPAVVIAAVVLAFLPPLFASSSYISALPSWIIRALSFLIISCPCALVISVPLSFFGGIGGASKKGILVKGSNYLEALAKADTVVFDKTGTLTRGDFTVTEIHSKNLTQEQLLKFAAFAECYSNHPVALALKNAYKGELDTERVSDVTELAGHGVNATVDSTAVACGNDKLMQSMGLSPSEYNQNGTVVHVAIDGKYSGYIVISDEVKPTSAGAIKAIRQAGVRRTVMLTGDREETAKAVCDSLGIDEYRAELLPAEKVAEVEKLLAEKPNSGNLVFVGDGINDAPVLMRADVGIAMGALGSDAAIEAADIVLMDDDPAKIAPAISIARKTLSIVRQNIVFALGVKAAVLILSIFGHAPMWAAVFADVGVSVIAILNAMRTLK